MDVKTQAVVDFLQTCPEIQSNPMFFNFGSIEENAHQASMSSDDVSLHQPYIDGSVLKRFTFNIDTFKSVAYNPLVSSATDENLEEFSEVQSVLDWVNDQDDAGNYPNFGSDCIIDKMQTLTTRPDLLNVDTTLNPPMAIYRITIQIDYLDNSKKIWS